MPLYAVLQRALKITYSSQVTIVLIPVVICYQLLETFLRTGRQWP